MTISNTPALPETLLTNPRQIDDRFQLHAQKVNRIDQQGDTRIDSLETGAEIVVATGEASSAITAGTIVGVDPANGEIFPWSQTTKPANSRPIGWAAVAVASGASGAFHVGGIVQSDSWPTGSGDLVPATFYYVNDAGNLIAAAARVTGQNYNLFGWSIGTDRLLLDLLASQAPAEVAGNLIVQGNLENTRNANLGSSTYVATAGVASFTVPAGTAVANDGFTMVVTVDGTQHNVSGNFIVGETQDDNATVIVDAVNNTASIGATASYDATNNLLTITSGTTGGSSTVAITFSTYVIAGSSNVPTVSATDGLAVDVDTITFDGNIRLPTGATFGDVFDVTGNHTVTLNRTPAVSVFHSGAAGTITVPNGVTDGQVVNIAAANTVTVVWGAAAANRRGISLGASAVIASGIWSADQEVWFFSETVA